VVSRGLENRPWSPGGHQPCQHSSKLSRRCMDLPGVGVVATGLEPGWGKCRVGDSWPSAESASATCPQPLENWSGGFAAHQFTHTSPSTTATTLDLFEISGGCRPPDPPLALNQAGESQARAWRPGPASPDPGTRLLPASQTQCVNDNNGQGSSAGRSCCDFLVLYQRGPGHPSPARPDLVLALRLGLHPLKNNVKASVQL